MPKKERYSRNKLVGALHDMKPDELKKTLGEFQGEMLIEEGKRSVGYPMSKEENYARYRNLKRDIARVKTEIRARELKK